VWYVTVRYTLEQCIFLYDTYVKYGSARKWRQKFQCEFRDERVPSRQTINSLVNKLISMGLLIDKKQKRKFWVLTEKKLDDKGARLEHAPRKSLKCPAHERGMTKSSARRATQLLKLRYYKRIVIHALQPHDPASWVHFCSWFLQSVVECEINLQLTFFSNAAWFHLQGYINTQNNHYWSSQNPHLIDKVLLHPVKVGVWCDASARMKQLIVKDMYRSISGISFQS
jgi:hypothetical protein